MLAARRLATLVLLAAVVVGCGGRSATQRLNEWECVQTAAERSLATRVLGNSDFDPAATSQQLAALQTPGLHPVSFLDTTGRPLPGGLLNRRQLDTFLAWRAGPPLFATVLDEDDAMIDAEGTADLHCRRSPLPATREISDNPGLAGALHAGDAHDLVAYASLSYRDPAANAAEAVVDAVVRGDHRPGVLDAAAAILGGRYVDDLLQSALSAPAAEAYDGDGDGLLGSSAANGIRISARQIADVLLALSHRDQAIRRLLNGVAIAEAAIMRKNMSAPSRAHDQWAAPLGAFDGILIEAAFAGHSHRFDEEALSFWDAVTAAIDGPPYDPASELAQKRKLDRHEYYLQSVHSFEGALAAAAVATGRAGTTAQIERQAQVRAGAHDSFLDENGRIRPYDDLGFRAQIAEIDWVRLGAGERALGFVTTAAGSERNFRIAGCCGRQ